MARFLKLSLLALLLTTLITHFQCAKAEDLQSMYLKAWLEIQNGFNLKDQKDYHDAQTRFKDALSILNQIHRIDPIWDAASVNARIRDCQRMLTELPRYSDDAPPNASSGNSSSSSPQPTNSSLEAAYQDLVTHNKSLKIELDRTKLDLANQRALVDQDRKEKVLINGRIAALTQELDELRTTHPGAASDVDSAKLVLENKDLKERQVVLEEQIKTLSEGGTNAAVSRLRDQLNAVQAELTSSEQANNTLQAENNGLKTKLESEISRVNTLLATAQNDTQLVRENTMLRDMLRHELQEQDRKEAAKRLAIEEFANLRVQSRVLKTQIQIITSPIVFLTPEEKEMAKTLIVPDMPLTDTMPKQPDFKIAQGDVATPSPAPDSSAPTQVTPATAPSPAPGIADTTPAPSPVDVAQATPTPSPSPSEMAQNTPSPSPSASPDLASTTPTPAPDTTQPAVSNYVPTPNPADVTPTPPPADGSQTVAAIPSTTTVHENSHIYTPATTPDPKDPTNLAKEPVVPIEMRAMAEEGAALFKMKRYDEAAARYESIIQKYPESLYAWSNLGVVRFQQGDYPESKKALQQAIKLSPNDALCRRNLGIVYYQIGSYEAAIDELTQSISMDSGDPLSHEYLGLACYQKGWVETCLKQLTKSLDIDDDQPAVHLYLSQVYANQRSDLDEGRKHYKRALELGVAKNEELEKKLQM